MSRIVIFGAGGRAGRAATGEALRRGHRVTTVVRDPARHTGLDHPVAGDVTDADSVARLAAGHDAVISAVHDAAAPPEMFYPCAARALLAGTARAGVRRLLLVGLASILETSAGPALMDTPGYPQEYRSFFLAHAAGVRVLRETATEVDWLVVSPAGDFDHGAGHTGGYRAAAGDAGSRISYPDLAVALLDEIDTPAHHRVHIGVEAV